MTLADGPNGAVAGFRGRAVSLGHPSPGQRLALTRLLEGGETENALADLVVAESAQRIAEWYWVVGALCDIGAVEWVVRDGGEDVARMVPLGAGFRPEFERFDPRRPHLLSAYAFLKREASHWALESPLARARVELVGRGADILAPLSRGGTPDDMAGLTGLEPGVAEPVLHLLEAAGMLGVTDSDGECSGDSEARAAGWAFHDALFHFRSRPGRSDAPVGVRPDAPLIPLPRSRSYDPAVRIALRVPDRARVAALDPPFAEVLEGRRSRRVYDARPIELEQLSELLFRSAMERVDEPDPGTVHRTYPSGGGCYPLEIYAVAQRCRGLPRAVYRYEPSGHALDPILTSPGALDALLAGYLGRASQHEIQVLLLVTLVPERINRRYDTIGYSLALKEVGGLFQSLYLVATAMGLAPCAVGTGDGEAAARVLGIDPIQECVVGEFALGSAPSERG